MTKILSARDFCSVCTGIMQYVPLCCAWSHFKGMDIHVGNKLLPYVGVTQCDVCVCIQKHPLFVYVHVYSTQMAHAPVSMLVYLFSH